MKVIFISNNLNSTHDRARVEEFIQQGIEVEVYGFTREADKGNIRNSDYFKPVVLGHVLPDYKTRIKTYYTAIKQLLESKKHENCIFYLFGLDVAMFFSFLGKKQKYVYEEADLVYTYTSNKLIKKVYKFIDEYVIKNSHLTAVTSEGFIKYHFGDKCPANIVLVPNKLNKSVLDVSSVQNSKKKEDLSFGFVGAPRFKTIHNFIKVFCQNFPDKEFQVYGGPIPDDFDDLRKFKNCIFHGKFSSPKDLPVIYSTLDLVLSTYDSEFENVQYAEPNKIYESIYFETPIIVSTNTFLAEKVNSLGIGYSINAMDDDEIVRFVKNLSYNDVHKCAENMKVIGKSECINNNTNFIDRILSIN